MTTTELPEVPPVKIDLHAMAKAWLEARDAVAGAVHAAEAAESELVACRQWLLDATAAMGAAVFAGVPADVTMRVTRAIQGSNGVVTVRHDGDGASVPYTAMFVAFVN